MSILSRLFGRKPVTSRPKYVGPSVDRDDVHRDFDVAADTDIVTGYKFCATIQLRTRFASFAAMARCIGAQIVNRQ